jgi:antitoxin (DNA-binding transcriptional repressor) of toxin-antitoxin stability system
MWNCLLHMKTVTIRQVHNDFSAVLALVAQGEEVTVLNRTRPVARICPPLPEAPTPVMMPDFSARAKAIFGDSELMPNLILEEREATALFAACPSSQ